MFKTTEQIWKENASWHDYEDDFGNQQSFQYFDTLEPKKEWISKDDLYKILNEEQKLNSDAYHIKIFARLKMRLENNGSKNE